MSKDENATALPGLLAMMARLRSPDDGCPWDLAQDFKSIAPYTVEEAYEVADAIARDDMDDLKDELGDLLLQVVFHAQMAAEQGLFDFNDVAAHVTAKMIHRHPHVFGDEQAENAGDVENRIWEERKDQEQKRKNQDSILDNVPLALPALLRAQKLQKRAARVGFEWPDAGGVLDKLEEELSEMREALAGGRTAEITDELGDLLFVLTNLGRMLGLDCEQTLRQTNDKFTRRFQGIERELKKQNKSFDDVSLAEMEAIWQDQKKLEKTG